MSGWQLIEDEIVEEASKDSTYCQLSVDIGVWAALTQAKKLVEWLEAEMLRNWREITGDPEAELPLENSLIDWQALRQEVGLKEEVVATRGTFFDPEFLTTTEREAKEEKHE